MKLFIAAAIAMLATPAFAQDQTTPAPAAPDATVGGYQPANPPLPANVPAGSTVQFQQAPSPSEAYPAPAAKDHYPPCHRGQTNGCRERENAAGEGIGGNRGPRWHHHHGRHHRWHHRHHHGVKTTSTTTTTTTK